MRPLAYALTMLGIAGLEGIIVAMSCGFPGAIAAVVSLVPLACSAVGLTLVYRQRRSKIDEVANGDGATTTTRCEKPEEPTDARSGDTAFGAQIVDAVPDSTELSAPIRDMDTRVYEAAIPALFESVVKYLNETSDPMSETLVKIGTAIADFHSCVRMSKDSLESVDCATTLKNGIERLRAHITELTDGTSRAFSVVSAEIDRLNDLMMSILGILGSISDVAERVHILSINASIESTRAGAQGRGFKVIADEIRKLAKETQSFVSTIGTTVDSTKGVFLSLKKVMESNQKNIDKEIVEDSSTYDAITRAMERHLGEFSALHSGTMNFIESLKVDMDSLSPLAMLHAIVTQEIENLERVTVDILALITLGYKDVDELAAACGIDESLARIRKRLTTSRELDALESAVRKLGLADRANLKRTNTEIEFF